MLPLLTKPVCSSTGPMCLEFVSAKCFLVMLKYLFVNVLSTKKIPIPVCFPTLNSCACLKCEWNRCFLLLDAILCCLQTSKLCVWVYTLYYLSPCCKARWSIISRQYWVALGPLYSHSCSPGSSRSREGQSDRRKHREGRLWSRRFSTSLTSGGWERE